MVLCEESVPAVSEATVAGLRGHLHSKAVVDALGVQDIAVQGAGGGGATIRSHVCCVWSLLLKRRRHGVGRVGAAREVGIGSRVVLEGALVLHVDSGRGCRGRVVGIGDGAGTLVVSHVPAQLLELSAHLGLCLAEVPGGGGQDATFKAHLPAAAARVMGDFVLLNITANLGGQPGRAVAVVMAAVGARRARHGKQEGTFCWRHSTHALRRGVVIV